ncbi:MAG: protein kinase, partial [Bradymonadaceae bacterium]
MEHDDDRQIGPFVLDERLDSGASAVVWRGRHRRTGVPVAVKIFDRGGVDPDKLAEHLEAEVQALAQLDHPNIISLFDYGRIDEPRGLIEQQESQRIPYLVMEHADGGTIRDDGELSEGFGSWNKIKRVLMDVLDALAYAHANDVIHRDIKPANVLVSRRSTPDAAVDPDTEPRIVLTDFGLAEAFRGQPRVRTQQRGSDDVGTPYYMAPEQFRSQWRSFGPWTDLYAVGCLAYEIVSGQPPFSGGNYFEVAQSHVDAPVPDLHPRLSVPGTFEDWVEKLLEGYERGTADDPVLAVGGRMVPAWVAGKPSFLPEEFYWLVGVTHR